jgi:hypothetical protein
VSVYSHKRASLTGRPAAPSLDGRQALMSGTPSRDLRQCIHCGKLIRRGLAQCPYCREAQTEVSVTAQPIKTGSRGYLRLGLLLILLAGVVQYFAGGYSPIELPPEITSAAVTYAVPVLGVGGAVLILYSLFQKMTS